MSLTALMTIYHRADPAELAAALQSLAVQTRPADEVVIVEDGPVGGAIRAVVDAFVDKHPARLVQLERNLGSGPASQAGLETITTDLVARLDADDVAHPTRFATQVAYLAEHPDIDVLGTAVEEFQDTPGGGKVRALPETHAEIARYARINSPVNNPSVMMRTEAVDHAGGYGDVRHLEDYDLWARMLADGARFHNLAEPLTYFRVSAQQTKRRTRDMLGPEWQLQRNLVRYGLVPRPRAVANLVMRTAYRLLPEGVLNRVYDTLFHR